MKLYLARPIFGQEASDVISYFKITASFFKSLGYEVYHPLVESETFRNEIKFKAEGYKGMPASSNHTIFGRDKWYVKNCDILYCNLVNSEIVSIGSCMELAWASLLGKHTVVAMGLNNIHRHAFVLEAGDVIFETNIEAQNYLIELLK